MRHIELITTGGTIEKTYDEATGELANRRSMVERMLRRLKLLDTEIHHRALMHKDSLLMTDDDRRLIVKAVRAALELSDAVVVLHGTDTLHLTGETIHTELPNLAKPVILSGAMRPFEMSRSDALQNLTESLLATSLLAPGVYAVAHGRALKFPGVIKDRELGSFRRA
ncbi:MAG: asparaginase domain-containing protein [Phycisphaerales bacterium]